MGVDHGKQNYLRTIISEHMHMLKGHIDSLRQLGIVIENEAQLESIRDHSSLSGMPPLYSEVIQYMGYSGECENGCAYDVRLIANDFCDDVDTIIRCNAQLQRISFDS